jgi:hypothetical protein
VKERRREGEKERRREGENVGIGGFENERIGGLKRFLGFIGFLVLKVRYNTITP